MTIININCCPISTQQPLSSSTPAPTSTTTPTPTPTITPTITPDIIFTAGRNSANVLGCANWDSSIGGNVTTVGTNGGPTAYGTFDQTGNISEWIDINRIITVGYGAGVGARGGNYSALTNGVIGIGDGFNSCNILRYGSANQAYKNLGFRIASSYSILNPLNLMNFVFVGDINNASDTICIDSDISIEVSGVGSVSYRYAIGKYPVTNNEYIEFLNAVASINDVNNLYKEMMAIIRSGNIGNYSYIVKNNYGNKPVYFLNWSNCARYCNWLHNGKPIGNQNNNTTEDGAYSIIAPSDHAVFKNVGAKYHLPTQNEWYKAAYYKGGGTNRGYWRYATQSNSEPMCVTANSAGDGL